MNAIMARETIPCMTGSVADECGGTVTSGFALCSVVAGSQGTTLIRLEQRAGSGMEARCEERFRKSFASRVEQGDMRMDFINVTISATFS